MGLTALYTCYSLKYVNKEFFKKMATIKIDDVEYDSDKLSENAKAQVVSLQFCQAEINRIKSQLAVYQTAAAGYTSALKNELDN